METADHIFKEVTDTVRSYFPDADLTPIQNAFSLAQELHEGQNRASGEPYIIHPLNVAKILAELHMDVSTIAAGILHDVLEDTKMSYDELAKKFGPAITKLVDGVTKLSKITFRSTEERQAESFRKMLVAMSEDIRVIMVKLADRLHNMRTLAALPEPKRLAIAKETIDIYAPLANRLGISQIKIELEDLCLRFLKPDIYYRLKEEIKGTRASREEYIKNSIHNIKEKMAEYDVHCEVKGRPKHFYSIFKKMEMRGVDLAQIHDLVAFRIVVDNIPECYKALGVIHASFTPVPGRFKDYIAVPKMNSYQSLHTMVIGLHGERIEIQIRTQEMNDVAERGIAAHWKYKEGIIAPAEAKQLNWVNQLLEWQKDLKDPGEFMDTVKTDLFTNEIYVFTPKGEVRELSRGATPLDFAYHVHTDVGNRCVGAKVNGRMVPLRHELKNGDTVEIITSPNQSPSKDWLKIVRSSRAKAKIRAYIKMFERQKAKELGQELLDKAARNLNYNLKPIVDNNAVTAPILEQLGIRSFEDLLIALGYGQLEPQKFIERCPGFVSQTQGPSAEQRKEDTFLQKIFKNARRKSDSGSLVRVDGLDDVLIRFGKCCTPLPGEEIVGFITLGRGVTVHATRCPRVADSDERRKVRVEWMATTAGGKRTGRIRVLCQDEPGALVNMSQAISGMGINITAANIHTTRDGRAVCTFDVEVGDLAHLQKLISTLESKKGIISVDRV